MKNLYLLLTIVQRNNTKEYVKFYNKNQVDVFYQILCNGTAKEKSLNLLGIEKTDKTMFLSVVTAERLMTVISGLTKEMQIDLPNRGVALAVPLASVGGKSSLNKLVSDEYSYNSDSKGEVMQSNYELIVTICEKGYTNLVMEAATQAGAAGGTTIKAKGTGAMVDKFLGLSLAQEKEVILIVSKTQSKAEIMKAIMKKAGVETEAHALVFSLPVSNTAGFRFADVIEQA